VKKTVIRAGLFGSPLAKSLSPDLFRIFSRLTGAEISYEAREAGPRDFASAVGQARAEGWAGFNVTLPLKQAACAMLRLADPAARAAGAVNAVRFGRAGLEGLNTDARALVEIFSERGLSLTGRTATVFGSGGAAGAAGWALGRCRAGRVTFRALSHHKAAALTSRLEECFPDTAFTAAPFAAPEAPEDILVNATPLGMYEDGLPPCSPAAGTLCVDMAYAPGGTPFMKAAEEAGAETVDGLEVLVWQAALALRFWSGLPTGDIVKFKQEALGLLKAEKGF
jgi:shikimate dehydrogenase